MCTSPRSRAPVLGPNAFAQPLSTRDLTDASTSTPRPRTVCVHGQEHVVSRETSCHQQLDGRMPQPPRLSTIDRTAPVTVVEHRPYGPPAQSATPPTAPGALQAACRHRDPRCWPRQLRSTSLASIQMGCSAIPPRDVAVHHEKTQMTGYKAHFCTCARSDPPHRTDSEDPRRPPSGRRSDSRSSRRRRMSRYSPGSANGTVV